MQQPVGRLAWAQVSRALATADAEGEPQVVEVEAQITGIVWKIEKRVGDEVNEEDVLLVIESMKMEIPVEAPSKGRVSEIHVAEGDSIEEGDIVVVLD